MSSGRAAQGLRLASKGHHFCLATETLLSSGRFREQRGRDALSPRKMKAMPLHPEGTSEPLEEPLGDGHKSH